MSRSRQPNVVFITTDHLRYDNIAANGNDVMHTPHLDRLAAEGVALDQCHVQAPTCMPSRASIWTGRYPQNHGVRCNGVALGRHEVTLAHAFSAGGYRTVNVGKLHFQPHSGRDHGRNDLDYAGYGYDVNLLSDEPGCYDDAYIKWVNTVAPQHVDASRVGNPPDREGHDEMWTFGAPTQFSHPDWITKHALAFIERRDRSRPLFLTMGFYNPHPPMNPPAEFLDLYDEADMPLPTMGDSEQEREMFEHRRPEWWRQVRRHFYAMVSHIDACVGRLLDALQRDGSDRETIVVFTSDHGDSLGDHGHIGKGPWNHDAITRVPVLARWPGGLGGGRRVAGLTEAIDLMPTLLSLCGVDIPHGVKGRDMATVWRGESEACREDVLTEHRQVDRGNAIKTLRTARFKYHLHHDGRERLSDLALDHAESPANDKATDPAYADDLAAMRQRLLTRLINAEDDLPPRTHPY